MKIWYSDFIVHTVAKNLEIENECLHCVCNNLDPNKNELKPGNFPNEQNMKKKKVRRKRSMCRAT